MRRQVPHNADIHHQHRSAHLAGQHVDGGAAAQEVEHHLARYALRIGAHALGRDAVVGRHDGYHLVVERRADAAGDPG